MFRYIVSATTSIGAYVEEEVLGGIRACLAISEHERLGSSDIQIKRKHDGLIISRSEIEAERRHEYDEMRALR